MNDIFMLVIIWAMLGLLVGILALAARLTPVWLAKYGWLWLELVGVGAALLGGGLGYWLFGPACATPMAIWVAVLVVCAFWLAAARNTKTIPVD